MDPFGDALVGGGDDPAAEFLQQEKEQLGDLTEELGLADAAAAAPALVLQTEPIPEASFEMIDAQQAMGDLTFDEPALAAVKIPAFEVGGSKYSPLTIMSDEPEQIKAWRAQQEKMLEDKDAKEETQQDELRQQARKELEDWYKHYDDQLDKTKATNRASQSEFVAEINDIAPGTEWDRVHKLCDFNAKTSRNAKDVSRMRSILLQLKQNPPAAAAAATPSKA